MNLDAIQLLAIESALKGRDAIINGGAGTGKTTIIKNIMNSMNGALLMALPGKAAARLKEATGYEARTIHSHLRWDGARCNRTCDFGCPVIIDEASMIDSWLMATLIKYKPSPLILVGDEAQLTSVGKGQPFHDLIKLRPDMVTTLTTCYRAQGAVHKAATAIRNGEAPLVSDKSGGESWLMKNTGDPHNTFSVLQKWIIGGHLDPNQDIILAPKYGTGEASDGGIKAINNMAKEILNPSEDEFSAGDRVIINKNFSADDLWNGDIGTITDIDTAGMPYIDLDRSNEIKLLKKNQLKEMSLAYCLSVHKSQGSQMRRVFFVCFDRHSRMLSRSLIYTAITRAQEGVCVMGNMRAFYAGINNVKSKRTVLQELGK